MHKLQADILNLFKVVDSGELSTTQIVDALFPDEIAQIKDIIDDALRDGLAKEQARDHKARLHRRVLHHLHVLISTKHITINRFGTKGERHFSIATNYKQTQSSTIPFNPAVPLEGYEHNNILYRYELTNWVNGLNAVLVEGTRLKSLDQLKDVTLLLFNHINDVVIINDAESLIERFSLEQLLEVFLSIEGACRDYNKRLSLIIDVTNVKQPGLLLGFLQALLPLQSEYITYVFDVTSRELMEQSDVFEHLIRLFSYHKLKFNIKNDTIHQAPLGIGRLGPYTIQPSEWSSYVQRSFKEGHLCVGFSQASVVIDMKRFFDEFSKAGQFAEMLRKVIRSMFIANAMQRRHAHEYFRVLYQHSLHNLLFPYNRMVVRLWNYDFDHPYLDKEGILALLTQTTGRSRDFCVNQETIYLSCGMPMRFCVGFGCAYRRFDQERLHLFDASDRIVIRSASDLHTKSLKQQLVFRERIGGIFDCGDEVRFHRVGFNNPGDVIREFQAILVSYRIPFFCYSFAEAAGTTITLDHFIE